MSERGDRKERELHSFVPSVRAKRRRSTVRLISNSSRSLEGGPSGGFKSGTAVGDFKPKMRSLLLPVSFCLLIAVASAAPASSPPASVSKVPSTPTTASASLSVPAWNVVEMESEFPRASRASINPLLQDSRTSSGFSSRPCRRPSTPPNCRPSSEFAARRPPSCLQFRPPSVKYTKMCLDVPQIDM